MKTLSTNDKHLELKEELRGTQSYMIGIRVRKRKKNRGEEQHTYIHKWQSEQFKPTASHASSKSPHTASHILPDLRNYFFSRAFPELMPIQDLQNETNVNGGSDIEIYEKRFTWTQNREAFQYLTIVFCKYVEFTIQIPQHAKKFIISSIIQWAGDLARCEIFYKKRYQSP